MKIYLATVLMMLVTGVGIHAETLYKTQVYVTGIVSLRMEGLRGINVSNGTDQMSFPYLLVCKDASRNKDLNDTLVAAEKSRQLTELKLRSKDGTSKTQYGTENSDNICIESAILVTAKLDQ